ncbi:MAG TPA: alpha/beta fold hydrolase [Pseudonocardia sp.]|uniref:alpha/beta fold hydrolase n=1 Tax=Pseudonocardia sp. TaxID=60912 RepID=UPI002B4B362B|nr:alpha/beta fold hydrolase [Pseudonocardia sp.]HLU60009.1 alpha/beta fold hydrolase [Pseudonocardia sp.]
MAPILPSWGLREPRITSPSHGAALPDVRPRADPLVVEVPPIWESRMNVVEAGDGFRVHYRSAGSGRRLVLVHGAGPGAEVTFGHLVDRFTDIATVVLPDLAGSDAAPDTGGAELTIANLVEHVRAVVEDGGDEPVDLVGFSLGAPVVVAVASTHPALVRRLVPVAGFSRADEVMRNQFIAWKRLADDAEGFGRLGTATGFSRDFLNSIGRAGVEELALNMKPTPSTLRQLDLVLGLDIRHLLTGVRAETLVIGETQDGTVPVANARELAAGIPGAEYVEVDCGHVGLFERPDEFVALIRGFIGRP